MAPHRADMQKVTGQCCSTSDSAVGTTSHLHRAGREPAAAAGLPGHAGDPWSQHHSRTHVWCPVSACNSRSPEAVRTSGSHSNWEEVQSVTSSLEMPHGDAQLFFSKARTRGILCKEQQAEEEQSKVMSCSVHGQSWALITTWCCECQNLT